MGSYVPSTEAERREMLKAIGLTDYRELYRDVPEKMYLDEPLNIPEGMSELEVSNAISAMAAKNKLFKTVLRGAGAYDHYIPSIVKYIPTKEEFLTAYTPYQAEMSQGVLQSIFEYHMRAHQHGRFQRLRIRWRYRRRRGCRHVPRPQAQGDAGFRSFPPGYHKHRTHLLLRHRR